jgi:segregation and condensation protein B
MSENKNLSVIESLLLAAGKPLSFKEIASVADVDVNKVSDLAESLQEKYNKDDSGIHVTVNNNKIQFVTNTANTDALQSYLKDETTGELSKPSLETLTIVAYRQPIAKEELEQIRGVNCSVILRNLLIRGLVEARESKGDLVPMYSVTIDFLRHLGIDSVEQLPDFAKLNSNENLQALIEGTKSEDKAEE